MSSVNSVRPGSLATRTVPPWRSTMARTNRQAESTPFTCRGPRWVRLVEALEHLPDVLGGNAGAGVDDLQRHRIAGHLGVHRHAAALGRVAKRVGHQIVHRLLEPMRSA